ncbi:MAG: class I SAM-dependent methyltransferase [Desulfobacteraceae bacterium]|nr:class I SAM-dependent methyltransferase [Desulfobacteraceae bacterium]
MITIGLNSIADLLFQITWNSHHVRHTETYAGRRVNFWRDLLPQRVMRAMMEKQTGDSSTMAFEPGELFNNGSKTSLIQIPRHRFCGDTIGLPDLQPRVGRFYPKGVLTDMTGIFPSNREPFRIAALENGHITIDMGHPLAAKPIALNISVGSVSPKFDERGGAVVDWIETITQGPGMQARWQNQVTDYFSECAFAREDEDPDKLFYAKPRLVDHLDDTALDMVRQIYARFMHDDMHVLDLMSSWHSHLPTNVRYQQVSGLGINARELEMNPLLSEYKVHDLNDDPTLPYADNSYDAIVCTASVEYLIQPGAVFSEAARVLRPGGYMIITFSNRWFPPKAIHLWTQVSEFERMGVVTEYFHQTQIFSELQTYSIRGLIRPRHDKYFGQVPFSDPIYAVWGKKL